jgi:hydrophobic/amphiphilic exporter-1 (mainly G- bacteria), HAE1 family
VIAYQQGGPVYVHDVGRAERTYEKQRSFVRSKGQSVLAMPARRETGSNVISVMEGLRRQIELVNEDILHARGLELELTQVYDETIYIRSAINLVRNNIFIGGALATIVLLWFLRNVRATGVVALSIPISVIATFLAVAMLGRNINVVMLAGMAFAVGMVVDNAVVVLENIYRHNQMGKSSFQAALEGGREVWGAILASTLTTMAVFLPVIFVEEEAGQLFRDIAIAIAAGVVMSLFVAILVIPTVSARVLGKSARNQSGKPSIGRIAHAIGTVVGWVNRKRFVQVALIVVFLVGSVGGSYMLMPPSDYLPSGNRNIVFGFVLTEPGLSIEEFRQISYEMEDHLRLYWETEPGSPEADGMPPVMMPFRGGVVPVKAPLINNFFFVCFTNNAFVGVTSQDDQNVAPLRVMLQEALNNSPTAVGANGFFQQAPLFGGRRSGNTVDVEIRGSVLADVEGVAGRLLVECASRFGYARPVPSNFDLPRPELRAEADRVKAADLGMTVRDVGFIVEASVDGAYIGGFRAEGDEIDLRIKLENADGTPIRNVAEVPLATPGGSIVPLASVVRFEEVGSPQQINHIEAMPGVTLEILAPPGMAIEEVMNAIDQDIVAPLRAEGAIPQGVYVSLAGTADKLVETRAAMFGHWTGWNASSLLSLIQSRGFLALLVVYLLMAALFESFIHPLAIMLTVPLATVGGFGGLAVIHWLSMRNPITPIQQLDVVTMLGFVILVGIVVNNAILIVHQTLNNIGYGMAHDEGLIEAVRSRVRPILMTAFTSIGGMLPLALMPGAGSELYRGLAGVMVGGLFVATLFTLILVPVVFSLFLELQMKLRGRVGRGVTIEEMAGPSAAEQRRSEKRPPIPSEPAGEVVMSGQGSSPSNPSGKSK